MWVGEWVCAHAHTRGGGGGDMCRRIYIVRMRSNVQAKKCARRQLAMGTQNGSAWAVCGDGYTQERHPLRGRSCISGFLLSADFVHDYVSQTPLRNPSWTSSLRTAAAGSCNRNTRNLLRWALLQDHSILSFPCKPSGLAADA